MQFSYAAVGSTLARGFLPGPCGFAAVTQHALSSCHQFISSCQDHTHQAPLVSPVTHSHALHTSPWQHNSSWQHQLWVQPGTSQPQLHYSRQLSLPTQPQQVRWLSSSDVARQRLVAAQQRRQREQEALDRQRASQAAVQDSSSHASTELQGVTAVAPHQEPPAEVQVAAVLDHPALIITRAIEWGTLILGFEQATKYTVYDQDGNVVALIAEEISGLGNELQRQLLRTRRSFTSTVLSADGSQVLFRVRRPAYLINSYMYIEDTHGEVIGEVRQRWHLWRRKYDLFMGKRQFAAINGGFIAWEFELQDAAGNTLALIDRNFLGFAREIFTDAGKYVVHFGYAPTTAAAMAEKTLAVRSGQPEVHVTPLAQARTDVAVIPTVTGNQLVVSRSLPLDERMIALAAAISVDYNFFSPHSHTSSWLSPPIFMPMPLPGGGGAAAGGAAAEGAAGSAAAGAAGAGAAEASAGGEMGAAASAASDTPVDLGGPDAGFSSGFGTPGAGGFADDADSFKWDDVAGAAAGGDEQSSSGLWGLLMGLWALIFGE